MLFRSNIKVEAYGQFRVKLENGDTVKQISLAPVNGVVDTTDLYIRTTAMTEGVYSGFVVVKIENVTGIDSIICPLSFVITGPNIEMNCPATSMHSSVVGMPSEAREFIISAASLTNNLVVSTTSGFEICETKTGTYTSSFTYTPDQYGSVSEKTIWIRMAASNNIGQTISGTIKAESSGAETITCPLSGTCNEESCVEMYSKTNWAYGSALEDGFQSTASTFYYQDGMVGLGCRGTNYRNMTLHPGDYEFEEEGANGYVVDSRKIGREHDCTPVKFRNPVCRRLLEKK